MKKILILVFFIHFFTFSQSIYVEYLETPKFNENFKKAMPKGMLAILSKSHLHILEYQNGECIYKNHPKSLNIKPYDTTYVNNGIETRETLFNNTIEKLFYTNTIEKLILFSQPRGEKIAYVKDKFIQYNWVISEETKKIKNFLCKKATSIAKGINYTVWFTEDVPIDCGPRMINGLPGLVIYAENNNIVIEMKKIINNSSVKIERPNFENQKTYTIDELTSEMLNSKNKKPETIISNDNNTTITKKKVTISNLE